MNYGIQQRLLYVNNKILEALNSLASEKREILRRKRLSLISSDLTSDKEKESSEDRVPIFIVGRASACNTQG